MYQLFYLIYVKTKIIIVTLLGYTIHVMVSILGLHSSLHMKLIY